MLKKYTSEEKYKSKAQRRKSSINAVAKKYGIKTTILSEWIARYASMRIARLQDAVGRSLLKR